MSSQLSNPNLSDSDQALVSRVQGSLLGQFAGDALGSMVEFHSRVGIAHDYPGGLRTMGASPVWGTLAGQPTDDSEMALVLARLLPDTNEFDEEQVANAYTFWRESDPFDVGGTIRRATDAMIHARQSGTSLSAGARAAANL